MAISRNDLKISEPLPTIFLLYGKNTYLIHLLQQKIIKRALPENDQDFNLSNFDMEEVPVQMAVEDAETLPFMGERRVVIIDNPVFLTHSQGKKVTVEHRPDRLQAYLESPSPDTILIIKAPYEKLDKRKKLVKTLQKTAKVFELTKMSDQLMYQLLKEIADERGVSYTQEAHQQLLAMAGPNMELLVREVEKLTLYCQDGGEITPEIVGSLASRTLEFDVFELVNRVMKREVSAAYRLLEDLFKQKEEPIKLLALITRQIRLMHQVALYQKQGYSQKQMASTLNAHPYAIKVASGQLKGYDEQTLRKALDLCADMDFQMKTGGMDKTLALELGIHKLASLGK